MSSLFRQLAAVAAGVAALIGAWAWNNHIVARRTEHKIERKADALASKAKSAQSRVVRDGAAERLRREYCPDCKR